MGIEQFIPVGKENAISRERLCQIYGKPDRATRKAIEDARKAGALILNLQDGAGYYRVGPGDLDDLARQYRQDTARAMAILNRRKKTRRILKEAGRHV